jgi:putative methyltransferase (TIGR04325 family)
MWSGNYAFWEEAKANYSGYDADNILKKCKNALLKVKNGEAVYEKDRVLFDEIRYSWGLLAGLQKAAVEGNNSIYVLDFEGSLESTNY